MSPEIKAAYTLELLRAVYNFGGSLPATEPLALADLRVIIARAENALRRPALIDPGYNPLEADDDL